MDKTLVLFFPSFQTKPRTDNHLRQEVLGLVHKLSVIKYKYECLFQVRLKG